MLTLTRTVAVFDQTDFIGSGVECFQVKLL